MLPAVHGGSPKHLHANRSPCKREIRVQQSAISPWIPGRVGLASWLQRLERVTKELGSGPLDKLMADR